MTARWTTGYIKVKDMGLSMSGTAETFMSGDRDGNRRHYPRETVQINIEQMTQAEADELRFFFRISQGETFKWIDEDSIEWPCRWASDLKITKDKSTNAGAPYRASFSLSGENISKTATVDSGTNNLA